jgi:RHS repeat-associated protein
MERVNRIYFVGIGKCLLLLGLVAVPLTLYGQLSEISNATSTPLAGVGHHYIEMLGETVNPANGSVSVHIEMPIPPGRQLNIPLSFNYSSAGIYQYVSIPNIAAVLTTGQDTSFGWSDSTPLMTSQHVSLPALDPNQGTCEYDTSFVFTDKFGQRHLMPILNVSTPNQCGDLGISANNNDSDEVYQASIQGQGVLVADRDGTVYSFGISPFIHPQSIEDRNGNTITPAAGAANAYKDTVGRTVFSESPFGQGTTTVTVSGIANPYTATFGSIPIAGWSANPQPYNIANNHCGDNSRSSIQSGNVPVLKTFTLPNGLSYQFGYDPTYGLLNKITYPTGASVSYTWDLNRSSDDSGFTWTLTTPGPVGNTTSTFSCSQSYDWPAITHRYVSYDGTNVALQQDFFYSTTVGPSTIGWSSKTTTVVSHDFVSGTTTKQVYNYVPSPFEPLPPDAARTSHMSGPIPLENTISYQDGAGNTLRTVHKTWLDPQHITSESTTLDTGATSETDYSYDPIPRLTEIDRYDYGQGSRGSLINKTVVTYADFVNTPIFPGQPSILDSPCQVITYDGAGHPAAETDYLYDNGTTVCGTAGTPSVTGVGGLPSGTHDETNYGSGSTSPRGNATQIIHKCFIPGTAQNCVDATTTQTFDETGQVVSRTDPNGNPPTQYSYSDNYDSGPASNTNTYLTKITRPSTNGISHVETFSYAYLDGQLLTHVDENSQTTTYVYNDPLRRLTEVDFNGTATTQYDYHNDSLPLTVTKTVVATPDPSVISSTVYDGFGHVATKSLDSDPAGADLVTFTYDGQGHKLTESNPYRGSSADGVTTYGYDPLGRVSQITKQDGSIVHMDYEQSAAAVTNSDCTKTTDEAGNPRMVCSDALGRFVEVDEPTGGAPATPGKGSAIVGSVNNNGTDLSAQVVNTPATSGAGSVQFSGAVQWKAVAASSSTGGTTNITVTGTEQQYPAGVTPGTGTVTIGGPGEQVIPGTHATGSVTISGNLQSTQVLVQAATKSSAVITVMGDLASVSECNWDPWNLLCVSPNLTLYDAGQSNLTVNGVDSVVFWSGAGPGGSGAYYTASGLVDTINNVYGGYANFPVTASAPNSNGAFTISSKATGASANYGLRTSSADSGPFPYTDWDGTSTTYNFGCCSYNLSVPASMSGGQDAVYTTVYDSGKCTITVNNYNNGNGDSYSWSGSGTTAAGIATGLAQTIHNDGSAPVDATASGATVNLTSRIPGAASNYSLSSSCTYDSSHFAGPSFSTSNSGSTLTGGKDEIDDHGTVYLTVNGHTTSADYTSGMAAQDVASKLASNINNDAAAFVSASASGAAVNLSSCFPYATSCPAGGRTVLGSIANYSMSTPVPAYDTGHFTQPSFTLASGAALTGGWPVATAVDHGTLTVTINSNPPHQISWGQGDNAASIATRLKSALATDTTVSTTLSNSTTLYLDPKTPGSVYTFSTAYTYDSANFTGSSFSPSNSISDYGTATIAANSSSPPLNGPSDSVPWAGHDTTTSIASALANKINGDSSALVNALGGAQIQSSGGTNVLKYFIDLGSGTAGTTYGFSVHVTNQGPTAVTVNVNAGATIPNGTINPGQTVLVTGTDSESGNNCGTGVPCDIQLRFNTANAGDAMNVIAFNPVITANGGSNLIPAPNLNFTGWNSYGGATIAVQGVVSLIARATGAKTNYNLASSTPYDNSHFSASSFGGSNSGATLVGGVDATYKTVYDSGTVIVNVNGTNYSASYGQNDTTTTIVKNLAAAMNAGGLVNAEVASDGKTINFIADASGGTTNYSLSPGGGSSQPSLFPTPSFSDSASGATLTGGNPATPGTLTSPWVTLYSYNALGNLLNVTQKGGTTDQTQFRVRTFSYDSLSRVLTSINPETGMISYSYDPNGNVLEKTSPAPNAQPGSAATLTISYCYDQINRVLAKGYASSPNPPQQCTGNPPSLPNPAVTRTYDQGGAAANAIGRLTSVTDQAGLASYSYDKMGRLTGESRTTAGKTMSMSYGYDLASALTTIIYPSKAVVTYTPNGSGRDVSAVDNGNTVNYATGASYAPDGSITGFVSGSSSTFAGITNAFSYNNRLQPITMSATGPGGTIFSLTYDFHKGLDDNGNVFGITNNKDNTRSQFFTYDTLNRLISAENAGTDCGPGTLNPNQTKFWGNNYGYDAWGNQLTRSVTKCSAENLALSADVHNQIHAGGGSDYKYDAAGNMTFNATPPTQTYTYDAENRIATAVTSSGTETYIYDVDGNRVGKSNGSTGTLYWYMSPGIVAESDLLGNLQSEYVFFDGERVARKDFPSSAVSYYFSDHLKTTDVVTDALGIIKNESDFYPYGGQLQFLNNDSNHYLFTGKERDSETGLDYFGARYYGNVLGRFMTPDPLLNSGKPWEPQTWNRYSYVSNNPLRFTDPTGLWEWDESKCGATKDECTKYKEQFRKAVAALQASRDNSKEGSKDRKRLDKVLGLIGKENDKGKLHVGFDDKLNYKGIALTGLTLPNGKGGVNMTLNFNAMPDDPNVRAAEVGHEGQHGTDERGFFKAIGFGLGYITSDEKRTKWEAEAYRTESSFYRGAGLDDTYNSTPVWNNSWAKLDEKEVESKQGAAARANAEQEVRELKKKPE